MGLKEWNTTLRSESYPPKTIVEALEFSKSEFVQYAYSNAETLGRNYLQQHCDGGGSNSFRRLFGLFTTGVKCLPPWAMTWPAGQLSTIGRSGNYSENIRRYNNVFSASFEGQKCDNSEKQSTSPDNKSGCVHIVPIEYQSDGSSLKMAMRPFISEVVLNCANRRKLAYATLMSSTDNAIDRLCAEQNFEVGHRRNSSTALSHAEFGPSNEDLSALAKHFKAESDWYSSQSR